MIFSLRSHSNHDRTDFTDWAINEALGPDKFNLLSPECTPECDDNDSASTCSSTDSEVSDRHPVESISTVTVPKFDQVLHVHDPVNVVPATLQHLHRLMSDIQLSDYYANLHAISPLLSADVAPCAHVDGGSIATTTDRKDYLFSFRPLALTKSETLFFALRWPMTQSTSHLAWVTSRFQVALPRITFMLSATSRHRFLLQFCPRML